MSPEGDEIAPLTVPKFSSFKSHQPQPQPQHRSSTRDRHRVEEEGAQERTPKRRRRNRDTDNRHQDPQTHYRNHRRREHEDLRRERDGQQEIRPARHAPRGLERQEPMKPENGVAGLFTIDTKGDPLITKYGSIDKSQVPSYYRHGHGRILGTPGRLVMHHDGQRDYFSIRVPGDSSFFSAKDGLRSKVAGVKRLQRKLRPKPTGSLDRDADEAVDFISMEEPRKKAGEVGGDDASSDDNQPDYRSIHKLKSGQEALEEDSSSQSTSSEDELDPVDQSNPLKWRSIQLTRQVKAHPEDIAAWMELVDHQDALLRAGEDFDRMVLEDEVHSFAEIKVSMLEAALKHTLDPTDRRAVLVRLMREGSKIWNAKTAAAKWAEVGPDEAADFELWKTHLDFACSNMSTFRHDVVKQMLLDKLATVINDASATEKVEDWSRAIYIFSRATRLLYDTGYQELAVASWQGLLELNFFRPPRLEASSAAIESFQDFWESEVRRVGEPNARGWRHFTESAGEVEVPEPATSRPLAYSSSKDHYKIWGMAESERQDNCQLPARTMDEEDDNDPFRVVMFSDIQPFLFTIPFHLLDASREQLLDALITFAGLPSAFRSGTNSEVADQTQFLFGANHFSQLEAAPSRLETGTEVQRRKIPEFQTDSFNTCPTPDLLFADDGWFHYLKPCNSTPIIRRWVEMVLEQLIRLADVQVVAGYYLALVSDQEPARVKKTAKALLKRNPTCESLYNSYALAELSHGHSDVAENVLASATNLNPAKHPQSLLLWTTWALVELKNGRKDAVLVRIRSSFDMDLRNTENKTLEAASKDIVATQETLLASLQESVINGNHGEAVLSAECLALLAYVFGSGDAQAEPSSPSQGNISAAMSLADSLLDQFQSRGLDASAALEPFFQFLTWILYFHASRGPFRKQFMRGRLARFVDLFPRNTMFLSLIEWCDAGIRVIDETRALLYEKCLTLKHDCASSRAFAIQHEMRRGNANTVKTAFERAVSSDVARSCPPLWISFIRFCYSERHLRKSAKDVFYRALRHCPWSKAVLMEAFGTLIRVMESDELRSVYHTMTSKGLRVHIDLDEFLENRRANKARSG